MCLVSVLKAGTEKYSDYVLKFIKSGFNCNKDGSGFMFKRAGSNQIIVDKGYFDYDLMILNYKNHNLTIDDEVVFHHRIGTSGLVSKFNTHPYVCSNIESEINVTTIGISKPVLAHNGFIANVANFEKLNPDFSDTYAFARYVMSDQRMYDLYDNNKELFSHLIKPMVNFSKVAILRPNAPMILIGDFIVDEQGYYHSNQGYCRYTNDIGGSSTSSFKRRGFTDMSQLSLTAGYYEDHFNNDEDNDSILGKQKDSSHSKRGSRAKKVRGKASWDESMQSRAIELGYPKESDKKIITSTLLLKYIKEGLRFNDAVISINELNFNHFVFLPKSVYEYQAKIGIFTIKSVKEFNPTTSDIVVEIHGHGVVALTKIEKSEFYKTHYFIPVPEYAPCYRGWLELIDSEKENNFGAQTLKKLERTCYTNRKKNDTYLVWYNRQNMFYPLLSLKLFKNIVAEELEFNKVKNNHVPQRIIEANQHTMNKVIDLFPPENNPGQIIILNNNLSEPKKSLKDELDEADKDLDNELIATDDGTKNS